MAGPEAAGKLRLERFDSGLRPAGVQAAVCFFRPRCRCGAFEKKALDIDEKNQSFD